MQALRCKTSGPVPLIGVCSPAVLLLRR